MADASTTPITTTPGTPAGSLAGTMATPQAPQAPAAPAAPAQAPAQNTGQSNQFGLSQVMTALEDKTKANNALMTQRNLLLKHLYDQPLSPEEQAKLDPTLLPAIKGNDRSQIDLSLRLIGDEIAGRTGTLDQSVQYLTSAYNTQQQNLETQRNDAINTVSDFVKQYGSNAKTALTSLYGQAYVDQLKNIGINLDTFGGVPTLAQTTSGIAVTPTFGNPVGNILGLQSFDTHAANPTLNRPTRNNNPGNIKVSDFSKNFPGVIGVESTAAADGGNFLIFDSPQAGLNAIGSLLQQGKSYQGVTAEEAMRRYSGGYDKNGKLNGKGYGAAAVGLDPKLGFQDQIKDPATLDAVTQALAQREGFAGAGTTSTATGLSSAAIDLAANQYLTTGQMPSLGLGSTAQVRAARTAILNRAAELGGGSIPGINKAQLGSLTSSLTEQTKYLNTIQRSINTVDDNLKILQEAASKVNNSSVPAINQLTNDIKLKTGDGALNAFKTAIQTVRSEYGNILARGGTVTDTVRGEAAQLIPDNITASQLNQVIDVLQREAQNVVGNAQDQVDTIQGQMSSLITGKPLTPPGNITPTGTTGSSADDILTKYGVKATTPTPAPSQPGALQKAIGGIGKFLTGR